MHFTLTSGDGTKNVTLTVKDAAGNPTAVTKSIVLDTVAPTVKDVSINSGNAYTTSSSVIVSFGITDGTSGVQSYMAAFPLGGAKP